MGTKIEARGFLREHSVIDLGGGTNNIGMRSLYHDNKILRSNENHGSYDLEKVRQTILEHESVFKSQLQELHRLYGRQRELMNEIKRREISKDDAKVEKCQLSYLFSPNPREDAKRPWNPYHSSSMAGCLLTSGTSVSLFSPAQDQSSLRSCEPRILNGAYNLGIPADMYSHNMEKQAPYSRDYKFSLSGVQTSQHRAAALTFDLNFKRNKNPGERSISNPTDGVSDRLTLSRGEISANSCSFNLVTKDFFQNSLDRKNGEISPSTLGLSGERSGKERFSDDYAEKRRFDKYSSVGDFCSGKPPAFPQSLSAEPRKQFLNRPLDMGASVFRKRKKIFGVEISEENEDQLDVASNKSTKFDQKSHDENHRGLFLESSSWIDNSFLQNLDLCGSNLNDGKSERSKADLTGEISNQQRFSDTKGKWSDGRSSIGLNFVEAPGQHNGSYPEKYVKNVDKVKMTAEVVKKDSDCQNKQENPKGGLPWFLRNSLVSDDQSKKKCSYFMNLDSLQNCSQKFFGKADLPDGTIQTSKQIKETSPPMAVEDAEGGITKVDDGASAKKILGFPISEVLLGQNLSKIDTHRGLNISDLRHCIDLNLSLDEEDAPSLPTAIVKIATTEIDLEAPAVIESETDASANEVESEKMDISPGKSELPSEDRDKIAAEAMITISLSTGKKSEDDNSLKLFAEVVSSHCSDSSNVLVEVLMNRNRARDEEEDESIPDGMDYFEFMTLKLEDKGEKHYHYEPFMLNNPSDDEAGPTQSKRSRRGQSRRGRQRKDFQRDVLPGLITLSRLEVKEDFQAFEELLKAEDGTWQTGLSQRSSTRNGRGRKRWGGANASPRIKTLCSTQAEQPICQLEERSLAGWGKRTRRLPRQRCPSALLSFPVKC